MSKTTYKKFFDINTIVRAAKKYSPSFDEKLFIKAFNFAEDAHRGQMRKDGKTPYIAHPVAVAQILCDMHADQDIMISALLHDVPEDTEHGIDEVSELFGEKVGFLVDGITKLSKVQYQPNMPNRQVESLKKLFLHSAEDPRVILIKLADRLHNMMTLANIPQPEKRLRIARETLEIYVPMANLLGIQQLKQKLEDLCFMHIFPSEYERVRLKLNNYEATKGKLAEEVLKELRKEFEKNGISAKINRRRKNFYSIYKKICSSTKGIDCIDNRIAIRVIVDSIPDCYHVLGIIHAKFTPKTSRFKDYIANPKSNGYQSLHTNVFGPSGVMTEIQIRTEKMDTEDQYGIMAHYFASENSRRGNLFIEDKRSLWVNKILEIEKEKNGSFLEDIKLDIFEDRIFVFTPRGRSIDLPKGASVIDFAYAIHTEVGTHAERAEINGLLKPISTVLKSGDQVNVITDKSISPEHAWLSFAKTNFAKKKIKEYFKRVSNKKKLQEGKKLLQKQLDIAGLGLVKNISAKKLKQFGNKEELLIKIGEGEVDSMSIIEVLRKKRLERYFKPGGIMRKIFYRSSKDGIRVNAKIKAANQFGLVREVSEVFYNNSVDMMYFKAWTSASLHEAYINVQVIVKDLKTVRKMFDQVKQIHGIKNVYRVSSRGLLFFSFVGFATLLAWLVHPFVYRYVGASAMAEMYPITTRVVLEGLLFGLLFSVFYLTNVAKKYFPIVRSKAYLGMISFVVPVIAFGLLYMEVVYFGLELSKLSILLEVLLFYSYVGMNFVNFKRST